MARVIWPSNWDARRDEPRFSTYIRFVVTQLQYDAIDVTEI
jgi:hypothetical protein